MARGLVPETSSRAYGWAQVQELQLQLSTFLAAAIQMNSLADKKANIATALQLVEDAAKRGALLVALPENLTYMGSDEGKAETAEPLDGPTFKQFSDKALELKIFLLAGSMPESGAPSNRVFNTSVLFGPDGKALAVYRKIHLFDVDIPDGARYKESSSTAPGSDLVVADTPLAKIGLSICYDLRFPELYRELSANGAELLTVPAAFTLHTGRDHWEALLRARAIENQCYVVAPAQFGQHSGNRATFGRAMIIDPWGTVVATASDGEGMAIAMIDRVLLERVRRELPALAGRRIC